MYIPKHFEETRIEALHALIQTYPLGALITNHDGEICANHIPFLIDPHEGDLGALQCHVAKSNPIWRNLDQDREALIIFQGPDCYISPSWYPSKQEHGKVVPTWDYIVVHARGKPIIKDENVWLVNHFHNLSELHESRQAIPWKVSDAPAEYINQMTEAIVGIEIPISLISGKWKVSQNRSESDKSGIVAGLESLGGEREKAISEVIQASRAK